MILRTIAACILGLMLLTGTAIAQDARIGLKIRTVTSEIRKQNQLPENAKGALVTAVTSGSPAQESGMVAGDLIFEANGKPVAAAKDVGVQFAVATAANADTIVFRVMNAKGEQREVKLPLPKRPAGATKQILPGPK